MSRSSSVAYAVIVVCWHLALVLRKSRRLIIFKRLFREGNKSFLRSTRRVGEIKIDEMMLEDIIDFKLQTSFPCEKNEIK